MPPVNILLVEDNPADIELTELSLEQVAETGHWRSQLYVVTDGLQALDFLRRVADYANAPRPDLILLDLNLPRKNGRQVLAEIKADDELKVIPVAVLSSSLANDDIRTVYQLHANCYIRKPASLSEFETVVEGLKGFWFDLVRLPPEE